MDICNYAGDSPSFSWAHASGAGKELPVLLSGHRHSLFVIDRQRTKGPDNGTIICLNGFSDYSYSYLRLLPVLTSLGMRTVCFDYIGRHGSSFWPGNQVPPYDMEFYLEQLERLIEAIGLELSPRPDSKQRLHLMGHSMGGLIACYFAQRHPTLVSSLCLIAPAGLTPRNTQARIAERAPICFLNWFVSGIERYERKQCQKGIHPRLYQTDFFQHRVRRQEMQFNRVVNGVKPIVQAMGSTLYHLPMTLTTRHKSVASAVGETGFPSLLMWGDSDLNCPPPTSQRWHECFPNATVITLPESRHCPHNECPEECDIALQAFYSQQFEA